MVSLTEHKRAAARVRSKAEAQGRAAMPHCCIPGCGRPPQAGEGRGLSQFHCRYHVQFKNRHGSYWKNTYRAAELRPYRRAAEKYLREHPEDKWIKLTMSALDSLMQRAGPVERVVDVLIMPPRDKARAALARLRRAEVPPEQLLTVFLAVAAAVAEDPIGPGGEPGEYRRVQVAKAAHRLASGYHTDCGYHRYPRSSGLALRYLGRMIEEQCEWVDEYHVEPVVALKIAMAGPRPPGPPPAFPKSKGPNLRPAERPRGRR
ncbi:hypothetical protein [Labrys wisconsinensis]|uniref:Uncharacterized protein n=1 Tax=Labrys wisconsinensis TaxID=425677 RepID=A0ABU0JLS8_9HYPH|nr:hypothetical protein [Labrys wisconsinensis]MDQ0475248.1 hypothetical protein [Labrys wisconsinensis]